MSTITRYTLPTTPCATERDRYLNMVFTTALEGGIGYWSACEVYRWHIGDPEQTEAKDFVAVVVDTEDDEEVYVIDRAVISKGIRAAYEHYKDDHGDTYQWRAIRDLHFGKWDDVDFDADTADMVVQFGLFGSLIYG